VADYLTSKGVAANRLTTVGKGEREPAYSNDSPSTKKLNRRVELFLQN
jgi:outer membrane protein OmpA-like peptidoglycan-associated protein